MTSNWFLNPESIRSYRRPFPYFIAELALENGVLASVVSWLENHNGWYLVTRDFYEQYELAWSDEQTPLEFSPLLDPTLMEMMCRQMGEIFNVEFSPLVDCTLHRLTRGQRIRIHNDYVQGNETHRLIVHLNREWRDVDGGFFMLFNSQDAVDVERVLRPLHGTVIGFEISENSHHAVSAVFAGERFSIVYSLYART